MTSVYPKVYTLALTVGLIPATKAIGIKPLFYSIVKKEKHQRRADRVLTTRSQPCCLQVRDPHHLKLRSVPEIIMRLCLLKILQRIRPLTFITTVNSKRYACPFCCPREVIVLVCVDQRLVTHRPVSKVLERSRTSEKAKRQGHIDTRASF